MNYEKIYRNYVEFVRKEVSEGRRPSDRSTYIFQRKKGILKKDEIFEFHHILPKCLGGEDSKENLIPLTPREHYLAHLTLWKIYPHENGIALALWAFNGAFKKEGFEFQKGLPSKIYQKLKESIDFGASQRGIKKSPEFCENLRKKRLGKKNSEETKRRIKEHHADVRGIKNANFGKKWSESQKKRASEIKKEYYKDPQNRSKPVLSRKKNGISYKGSLNPNAKKVICTTTNEVFDSVKDCCKKIFNNDEHGICQCVAEAARGKRKTKTPFSFKGYSFKYEEV